VRRRRVRAVPKSENNEVEAKIKAIEQEQAY
jgi:hypothetical protein